MYEFVKFFNSESTYDAIKLGLLCQRVLIEYRNVIYKQIYVNVDIKLIHEQDRKYYFHGILSK